MQLFTCASCQQPLHFDVCPFARSEPALKKIRFVHESLEEASAASKKVA